MARWARGLGAGALVFAALAAIGVVVARALASRSGQAPAPALSVASALAGGDDPRFAHADAPRAFAFPADHGPHERYRSEWWYWTGNLDADDGRRFGYQFTVFRIGLSAQQPPRASAWATNEVYAAHLALSDARGHRFLFAHDQARGAVGLAGAAADPFQVWVGSWRAGGWSPLAIDAAARATAPEAETPFALALALGTGKPPVLEGDHGLSAKGGGGASYYYSLTRMPTSGTITIGGERFSVRGASWKDREWSTSALGPDEVGWDWFALQLDDGRELMAYRMRHADGSADPASSGTLVHADGTAEHLGWDRLAISSSARWASPRGGTYPARWHVVVKDAGIDLEVVPVLADQELDVGVRYWEGAVDVAGTGRGRGYVELTGYADAMPGSDRASAR